MRHLRRILAGLAGAAALASAAAAQGSLGQQGFGYPLGLSTRALSSGGALAEIDPQTPSNPAAIVMAARAQAYGQYEPEFRTVTVGNASAKTTTSRFPMFTATGRQGQATFALSFGSLLDRSWTNTYADTQVVGGEKIASTVITHSQGGIADASGSMAWSFNDQVHVGAAVHLYPGQNRVTAGRTFADSDHVGSFGVTNDYAFSGAAFSLGTVLLPGAHVVVAGDVRLGGDLKMRLGDSTLTGRGKVPFRYALSVAYDGVPGALFAVRFGGDKWSDLKGLGSSGLGLKDATDLSAGAEIIGPRTGSAAVVFRAGFRSRGLPFTYQGSAVNETSYAAGTGIPIVGGRAMVDLGFSHASRSLGAINEKAWTVSVGVGIRP